MHLHLVGGFLGSGKTTAIIGAARYLIATGKRVGVVTNDQGKYLVDTAFFRSQNLPTVEVTGGCFCCNYDDLAARLTQLQKSAWPDVIFAESVGSCADVVATVVKPYMDLQDEGIPLASYSVLVDARMLRRRLSNQPMPFGDDVVYIFDKQIEESGLLILNKSDLLAPSDIQTTLDQAQSRFPGKTIHVQNSRNSDDIALWVNKVEFDPSLIPQTTVEIDYQRYGAGEANLAWLDEAVTICSKDGALHTTAHNIIQGIQNALRLHDLPIGHVKFMLDTGQQQVKISLAPHETSAWQSELPDLSGTTLNLLINARVQTPAEKLREIIRSAMVSAVAESGAVMTELDVAYFHPGFPRPTHRMS